MSNAEFDLVDGVLASKWVRPLARLALLVVALWLLWTAFGAFVSVRTDQMWFKTVDAVFVRDTELKAQVLLFLVFGVFTALVVGAALWAVTRSAPRELPVREDHPWRFLFLKVEPALRWWVIVIVAVYYGVGAGSSASSQWPTYLLWRHAVPWGQKDPQFHRDISYYVEVLPFHQMVATAVSATAWSAVVVTFVAAVVYDTVHLRRARPWVTRPFVAQMSVLLGLWLLGKAALYWLGRYALTSTGNGPVTGLSYTDIHARVPGGLILMVVALGCAVVLFVNGRQGRLRIGVAALAVMLVASLLVGSAWPSLVSRFKEQPSAATTDRLTIERNLKATREAFGLKNVTRQSVAGTAATSSTADLLAQAERGVQVRLLDPNQLTPTFNVKQQIQAYYQFKSSLDIDHYTLDGVETDLALAARELNLGGISRSTWTNRHLVYTHGYGVVAAPTDQLNPSTGIPDFVNGGLPPKNAIPVTQPSIYFGQNEPNYSIVGEPKGSTTHLEFDYPSSSGSQAAAHTTYAGDGGVPIGSRFGRFLWAAKLGDPNIFFSSDVNSGSQLLTVRDPRTRVAKVAPWLILDGDVYPALVDGKVQWIVDGYTTTNNFPGAQTVNLRGVTSSALTNSGATVRQPNVGINYMQNSVKAVVDAYTGKVTLYSWNQSAQPDPLLKAWEGVFPGLVKPESDIPADLMDHLRYPQDLFDVQRSLLASYHITDAGDFYNGSGFWKVPTDPTFAATSSLNSGTTGGGASPTMASAYMSLSPTGDGDMTYALSTPLVTLNYRDLAGFLSVDAAPGPDYGKFTLLDFPAGQSVESPAQIQNDIESDATIAKALTLERSGNSQVLLGNLLTIPLDGQILYVEPVYTQASGGTSFPILRHVIAVYGDGQPAFEPTLDQALTQAFENAQSSESTSGATDGSTGTSTSGS